MDPISTISGPVNAEAFVDHVATISGAATMTEFGQLINKSNEIIGGLTEVAGDLDTLEADVAAKGATISGIQADLVQETNNRTNADLALAAITGALDAADEAMDVRIDALEAAVAAGATHGTYLEIGDVELNPPKWIEPTTEHTINFTGTTGIQSLWLEDPASDAAFLTGMNWIVVCNNAAGVRIFSTTWADAALASGLTSRHLRVGDMAIVSCVDIGSTKKWSAAVLVTTRGSRSEAALAGDLADIDANDRFIWVNRAGDTGTRDVNLPDITESTASNDHREVCIVLYGTPTSGTFVVNAVGAGVTFIGGATTYTMLDRSACRFVANKNLGLWAVFEGGPV